MAGLLDLLKKRLVGTPYTALSAVAPNPDPLIADPNAYDAWKERLRTVHPDDPEYSKVPWNMSTIVTPFGLSHTGEYHDYPVHQTDEKGKYARSWKEIYPMAGKPTVQHEGTHGLLNKSTSGRGLNTKAFWEAMAEQEPYVDQTTAPPGGKVGRTTAYETQPYNVAGGLSGLEEWKKRLLRGIV